MFAPRTHLRTSDVVVRAAIVGLALATGYIHSTLGGLLFTLNAVGYLTAAVAMVIPLALAVRFRWVIVVFVTELTTPRMTEPAGIIIRSFSRKSTSVVASNRSSTNAVAELSDCDRRTSSSVPTGISVRDVDDDDDRLELLLDALLDEVVERVVGRAWSRTVSMRSRMSKYSVRETASFFRILTFR